MSKTRGHADVEATIRKIELNLPAPTILWRDPPKRTTLQDRMAHYRVPGISIAVISEDRVEWTRGYGLREAGQPGLVTADTLFQVGSMSKAISAVGALRLVDEGVLDLDEDINRRLVSWTIPANGTWVPRVTLRHLLSHAGGVSVQLFPGYATDDAIPTLGQILDGAEPANSAPIRVHLIPGTHYRYSSGGYTVLQQLLIDVTGRSFPALMRELVLDPLGMANSTFEQPLPESRWTTAAVGHRKGAQPVGGKWFIYPEMAQGGLWTTASDLARFLLEVQRAGQGRPNALLSAHVASDMFTPPYAPDVGLGIFLDGVGASRRFSHQGGNEGFSSRIVAYLSRALGAVVLTNFHYPLLVDDVMQAISLEYGWPGYLPRRPSRIDEFPATNEHYVGDYTVASGGVIRIKTRGAALLLEVEGQAPIELVPTSESTFAAEVVNCEVVFSRAPDGHVAALALRHEGHELPAKKVGQLPTCRTK
jgi:CubicO group peptidase (beta-lactamase class C family)